MFASPDTVAAPGRSGATTPVAVLLSLWLVLVFLLGAGGAFVNPAGTPPLAILGGFLIPVAAFVAAYRGIGRFRDLVLSLDLRLVIGMQAWRFAGLGFIALTTNGVLPGSFAWPAALGDMAIGVTAPWVILALVRQPRFVSSPLFIAWNLFGILDLIVALSTGALSAILAAGHSGGITTAPMAQLPLILIPAYLVPVFFMLHLAALFQARERMSQAKTAPSP